MKQIVYLTTLALLAGCGGKTTKEQPTANKQEIKQYSIAQFMSSIRIGGGVFSEDESKILVHSNETGISNVYEITIADGQKRQLTFSEKESYYAIDYIHGTNDILYGADKGGNELSHIYLQKEDGTTTDLTPDEKAVSNFMKWNPERTFFYYSSTKRDGRMFDLYKMNIADWTSEMLFKNKTGYQYGSISDNGEFLTLSMQINSSQNLLFVYNAKTNEMHEVSDSSNVAEYRPTGFSNDSKKLFYLTNAGREFTALHEYDIESGVSKVIYETKWDVVFSYLSENETYRVISINEDARNKVLLLDEATGKQIDFPEITDGDILGVRIAKSEKQMLLHVGSSTNNRDMYVYNFDTKELKRLTETMNPEIDQNHLVNAEVVRYKSFDGLEIPAIFYKPHQASASDKVPALVMVHGGPGGQSRAGFNPVNQYLVNHGYAVLAVNNRGSSGYGKSFFEMDNRNHGDKDLKDCIWGKKWLQQQKYIDADKIGIMGGSYGGFMTMAALAFEPDEFEVGVDIFGVTNWLRTLRSIPPFWEAGRKSIYAEMGDPFTEDSVRLYNISPLFHANQIKKPVMVLQGANDPRVVKAESDEIVAAVKANNVPVEYVLFDDEGHSFVKKENQIEGYGKILEFLNQHLKGEEKPAVK